ncbi:hypothetical protein [Dawidia soli]|uniref:Uncharacterized protein n=1 Tax=Dawidia soli TaxID=2782352 RepID=A0AAP2D6H8_9BACT|nr:hypothetical protein [Dawidia soli]MBT1686238.1 hypothetical protein [Dawidia soli]
MKGKGIVFLLVALVLPSVIFVFLKFFGKNEFAVEPLFQVAPAAGVPIACGHVTFPYHVPDSVLRNTLQHKKIDTVLLVVLGELDKESGTQLARIEETFGDSRFMERLTFPKKELEEMYRTCVFLLPESHNVVMLDETGTIRGQYNASDREDVDRLLTELTIVFKKY